MYLPDLTGQSWTKVFYGDGLKGTWIESRKKIKYIFLCTTLAFNQKHVDDKLTFSVNSHLAS
jgi:hypothetical protein